MTIHYKIKKADSKEYWTGYSSVFSKNGVAYTTLEDAGAAIQAQLKNSKTGIAVWSQTAQVIAFKVEINAVCSYQLTSTITLAKYYERLKTDYGISFVAAFKLLSGRSIESQHKYAVRIQAQKYPEFRSLLKSLGYSSRAYKKLGDWIFFSDDDVCVRVKLIGAHSKFVNVQPLFDEYLACTVATPADNELMIDAVFEPDDTLNEDDDL